MTPRPPQETAYGASFPGPHRARWGDALLTLVLSLLFPGTGQHRLGAPGRGCLWSLAHVGVVLPGVLLAYIGLSSRGAGVGWVALSLLAVFLALAAVGPVRAAWRGALRLRSRPPLWRLECHAALVALLVVFEVRLLLWDSFQKHTVQTASLEPFIGVGETVTVLRSSIVRPVHGDLLWCRVKDARDAGAEPALMLGLALACAGDLVQADGERLLVNGIELDLGRGDQRFELERAGRGTRRRRFFAALRRSTPTKADSSVSSPELDFEWGTGCEGTLLVPPATTLVLLDAVDHALATTVSGSLRHRGWLVHKRDIVGRVIE